MRSSGKWCFAVVAALCACSSERAAPIEPTRSDAVVRALRTLVPSAPWSGAARSAVSDLRVDIPARSTGAVRLARGAAVLDITPLDVRDVSLVSDGNTASAVNVSAGVDILYLSTPSMFEDFRLLRAETDSITVRYQLRNVAGIKDIRVSGHRIEAVNDAGATVFGTDDVFAVDSSGERRLADLALDSAWTLTVSVSLKRMRFPVALDPGWSAIAPMNFARRAYKMVTLSNGNAVVATGDGSDRRIDVYDRVANKWTWWPSLFGHTSGALFALPGAKVLMVGGHNTAPFSGGGLEKRTEIYDPATMTATTGGSLAEARQQFAAVTLASGKFLVAGGLATSKSPNVYMSSAEVYDPATDTWSSAGNMVGARAYPQAVRLASGKVLVAGGLADDMNSKTATIYDPATNSWSATAALAIAGQTEGGAVLLPSGKAMLFGGYSGAIVATTQVYDPALDTWTLGPAMAAARASFAYGMVGGKLVVAGGLTPAGTTLNTVEIFDPATSTWSAGPPMSANRRWVSGTVLGSGEFLVAGGYDGSKELASAEVYSAASGCTTTAMCAAGEFCSMGSCRALLTNGAACTDPTHCKSGLCADGLCCDKACTGPCEACSATLKGGGVDGTCASVAADTDPKSKCALDPGYPGNCRADGMCDGAGACRSFAKASTACGDTTCVDGKVSGQLCDGSGACKAAAGTSCGAYKCDATGKACKATCASAADCIDGYTCTSGACVTTMTTGRKDGEACAEASQCTSANCVDGVCCNVACDGQCQACDVPGKVGTCAVIAGAPHGARVKCGDGACAGKCDGVDSQRCVYPAAGGACESACVSEALETRGCDGKGACIAMSTTPCAPYICQGSACGTTCAKNADCAPASVCSDGKCLPIATDPGVETTGCGCEVVRAGEGGGALALLGLLATYARRRRSSRPTAT